MYEAIAAAGEALLVIRLPAERIVLATDSARALLAPSGGDPVGRPLSAFLDAPLGDSAHLLARGRLAGFQLYRVLLQPPADDLEIWVSSAAADSDFDDAAEPEQVLALLSQGGAGLRWAARRDDAGEPTTMTGWADRQLMLQRVDGAATALAGRPAEELVGHSLLSLVAPGDLTNLLYALGQLAGSQEAVSLLVRPAGADPGMPRCRLVLVPFSPAPACGFALQAAEPAGTDPLLSLRRFGQGMLAAGTARELRTDPARPGLPELTSRELQIVDRLLAGDRVPAISRQLYLAQSTVRNHLSAVFAKLGVRSQQELIVLLRQAQSRQD